MPMPMMQQQQQQQQQQQYASSSADQKSRRPEMRGPSADVSDMMSRLKTKTINIQASSSSSSSLNQQQQSNESGGNVTLHNILSGMTGGGSDDISLDANVINISSLGDIPQDAAPHKSKRRQRSDRNTVSMDL
jgi:hypothetical protein